MITPAATGGCRLDTVTKGKTVSLIQKSFVFNDKDRHYAETIYPMVQESIREGIFLPRRSSPLCSRRFCGFWSVCEKEYGGICVATKVTTKYPIQIRERLLGFSRVHAR